MRALIFDFDGLILDTEWPEYEGWHLILREHGCDLAARDWVQVIGTGREMIGFDPVVYLAEALGVPVGHLDREALEERAEQHRLDGIARQPILPGVIEHIEAAERLGLKLAVASSSEREWVVGYLKQRGLLGRFDAVLTRDDVGGQVKPAPDVFLAALAALGVAPGEAIVYEDSAPGIAAARKAGIFTVVVPNPLTRTTDLGGADLQVASLADTSLAAIIERARNGHDQ